MATEETTTKFKGDVSDLLAAVAEAKAAMESFSDSVKKNTDKSKKSTEGAGKAFDDFARLLGRDLKQGETSTDAFNQKANELTNRIKNLKKEINSGNGNTTSLFGDLKKTQGDLSKVEGYLKDIGGESGNIFTRFGQAKEEAAGLVPLLMQMGVAAAPFLIPVAAGSLLGVLGAGGLALGIAGQLHNADVQSALATLGSDVKTELHNSTSAFGPELTKSINILDQGVSGFIKDLKPAEDALAPILTVFTKKVTGGLLTAGPLFAQAMARSKPDVAALGGLISDLEVGTGEFFNNLSIGAQGGALAINDLGTEIKDLEGELGTALGGITALYGGISTGEHWLDQASGGTLGWKTALNELWTSANQVINPLNALKGAGDLLNRTFGGGKTSADGFNGAVMALTGNEKGSGLTAAQALTSAYTDLATAMDKAESNALTLDQSELNLKQATADLSSTLKKNKDNWNQNTQAGRDDWSQLLTTLGAIQKVHDAQVASGGATAKNTAAYFHNVDSLLALARQAGLSKAAIAKLKTQFEELPSSKTITIKVKLTGSTAGAALLGSGQRTVSANSNIRIAGRQSFANSGTVSGGRSYADSGDATGLYAGRNGGIFRFAERSTGVEALISRGGDPGRGMAATAQAARWFGAHLAPGPSMASGIDYSSASGGGGPTVVHSVIQIDGKTVVEALTPAAQRRGHRNAGVTGLG